MRAELTEQSIKAAVKAAMAESLREHRKMLRKMCRELVAEMFEDIALGKAIEAGRRTGLASEDKIDRLLSR